MKTKKKQNKNSKNANVVLISTGLSSTNFLLFIIFPPKFLSSGYWNILTKGPTFGKRNSLINII